MAHKNYFAFGSLFFGTIEMISPLFTATVRCRDYIIKAVQEFYRFLKPKLLAC